MFDLTEVQGQVLSRHERLEQGLGAFARAVRDGWSAETLTLRPVAGARLSAESAPEAQPA
jgi:hypothetical protein